MHTFGRHFCRVIYVPFRRLHMMPGRCVSSFHHLYMYAHSGDDIAQRGGATDARAARWREFTFQHIFFIGLHSNGQWLWFLAPISPHFVVLAIWMVRLTARLEWFVQHKRDLSLYWFESEKKKQKQTNASHDDERVYLSFY